MHWLLRGLLLILSLAAAAGCGSGKPRMDYSKAGLVDVAGTVRLDGAALPGAIVIFESPDETFSFARTDGEGRYRLRFDSVMSGVTKGPKTVRIKTLGSLGEDDPDAKRTGTETVPDCYNAKSTLAVEVTEASTATDFDLRSDCGRSTAFCFGGSPARDLPGVQGGWPARGEMQIGPL